VDTCRVSAQMQVQRRRNSAHVASQRTERQSTTGWGVRVSRLYGRTVASSNAGIRTLTRGADLPFWRARRRSPWRCSVRAFGDSRDRSLEQARGESPTIAASSCRRSRTATVAVGERCSRMAEVAGQRSRSLVGWRVAPRCVGRCVFEFAHGRTVGKGRGVTGRSSCCRGRSERRSVEHDAIHAPWFGPPVQPPLRDVRER
jgi:hypothetical protein